MDMFPQTTKQRKRLWICSHARKISKDIQPILSSHTDLPFSTMVGNHYTIKIRFLPFCGIMDLYRRNVIRCILKW